VDSPHGKPTPYDISVVLCTRDRPTQLARALEVLLERAPAGAEIIVVDSGSASVQTQRVADRAGVIFIRSDVPGLSVARNVGLRAASRTIVVYTDDDCAVASGFGEALTAAFQDARIGAATWRLVDHATADAATTAPCTGAVELVTDTVDGLDAGHGALMAFDRERLIGLGGFDPLLGAGRRYGGAEDLDAFCRILHSGSMVARVADAVVIHENTRDDEDYARLNAAYGRGLGAMCRKWRDIDRAAARALSRTVLRRAAKRALRRLGSARTRRADAAFIGGVWIGMRETRAIPVSDGVFADLQPLAPVVARDIVVEETA
jgi:glycosyltransferase involved in cell wall biosynthesis